MTITQRAIKLASRDSTELDVLTYENGELYFDQSNFTLRLMDSVTQGGVKLATQPWVQNNLNTVSQPMSLTDTTQSTSTGTGSLKVSGGAGIVKNVYVGQELRVAGATVLNSTLAVTNNFSVNTDKFTVDSTTGNIAVAGTLALANDFSIATNKFSVNHSTGNTVVAGELLIASDFKINTDKFTVESTTGDVDVAGNIVSVGTVTAGNLKMDGGLNSIASTNNNGNIVLSPNGAGYVSITGTNALVIPSGTSGQQGPAVNGAIRLNTTYGQFEGYSGGNWSSLGGVRSVDGQTYIIAETSPGASDDTLHFYAGNTEVATLTSTKLSILANTVSNGSSAGALTVVGGVGIGGDLYVGGNLNIQGTELSIGSATFNNGLTLSGSDTAATEYFKVNNATGVTKFSVDSATGNTVVAGTLDPAGDFKVATNKFTVASSTGNTVVAGTLNVTSDVQVGTYNGGFTVNANTGNVIIQGSLTTYGTSYQVGGGTTISDPLITLHTGTFTNNDGVDIGVFYNYYDTEQRDGFFGRVNSSGYLEYYSVATVAGGVFSGTYGTYKGAGFISTGNSTFGGDIAVNGGDITTTSTGTATVFNTNATTLNIGQASTTVSIGAATGTTTVRNDLSSGAVTSSGNVAANGGSLTTTQTTANLFNDTATTLNIGGAATTIGLGTSTGTFTIGTPTIVGTQTTQTLWNTTATTINFAGAATTLNIGNASGTTAVAGALSCLSITESSSISLKENINPITNALDIISKLEGVTYDRKNGTAKMEAGLIAEAVDKVLPNIVKHDQYGRAEGINYTKLTAYLIEAVKELTKKVDQLSNK
jgi:hypothetical protein